MEYYINERAQNTGEYEIHTTSCIFFNIIKDKKYLGNFNRCSEAIEKAKLMGYKNVYGCYYCCKECHTK